MPFTATQFFDVFRRYNEFFWPAQIALSVVAVLAWAAASRRAVRISLVLLSALWLWAGMAYFKLFFATITRSGQVFGSLFVAEAALLLIAAWQNERRTAAPISAAIGVFFVAYALVFYPPFGEGPTFGTPCPVATFTFGIFCLLPASIPRFAVAIPILWAVIATDAALVFGVRQDFALPVAALAALLVFAHEAHIEAARRKASQLPMTPATPMASRSA